MAIGYSLQTTEFNERRLLDTGAATALAPRFEWYTGWFLATGIDVLRGAITINGASSGNFRATLAIQAAQNRMDAPGIPQILLIGGTFLSASASTRDQNVTSSLATAQLFRLGIAYYSTSGMSQADVGLQVGWAGRGTPAGSSTVMLTNAAAQAKTEALTPWFPQKFAQAIRIAYEIDSIVGTGTLNAQFVAQTAPYSTSLPGAFNAIALNSLSAVAAGEFNTGDLALVGNDDMWMRVGVYYTLSAGTQTSAMLSANISVKS